MTTDYNHERLIDGVIVLYCPIADKPLKAYEVGVVGDTAYSDKSRGKGLTACNLCSDDKRTIGARLHHINEERKARKARMGQ